MLNALIDNAIIRLFIRILIFSVFLTLIIALLPVIPFDDDMQSAFVWLFTNLWKLDWLLPIGTLIACVVIVISAEISMMMINFYFWIKASISK